MKKRLLLFGLLLLQLQPSKASHVLGGEMSYKCLGNGNYEFTVALYRDCNGIAWEQPSVIVNGPSGPFTLVRLQGADGVRDISQRCVTATFFGCGTNPASGTGPNGTVAKLTYKGITNLSALAAPSAAGYMFTMTNIPVNVRNANNNMGGGSSMGLRVIMYPFINPATGDALTPAQICDNSPAFVEDPAGLQLLNPLDTARFSSFATDRDLDSLVYKSDFPFTGNLVPMFYTGTFSVNNPLPNTPPVAPVGTPAMNPSTGTFSFRPSQSGNFLTCVKIESWRYGQKISEVYRDFQIQVISAPAGSPPPFVPGNLATQRAPIITPPAYTASGQPRYTFDFFVGDEIDMMVSATDYYPIFDANLNPLPLPAGEFSVVVNGPQLSNTNDPSGNCLLPPCATLRGLTDPALPASVVTPPTTILAGNGTPLGLGYNATFEGGGRLVWAPECSNIAPDSTTTMGLRRSTYQFAAVAVDKNCPVVGKEIQVYTFNIHPLPKATPAELTSITTAGSQKQLNFITSFDTLSIDPIDAINYADSTTAFKRAKSVNRRYDAFQGYQIYKSLVKAGPYALLATISNPFASSWLDTSAALGQFYFISTVSGCWEAVSSDTISTCQTQAVAINSPGGNFYCPTTGTVISALTNATGAFQWYKDGVAIVGATAATYLVMSPGVYAFGVTDSTGCQSFAPIQPMAPSDLPYEGEVICAVTVDLTTGLNAVIWEKTEDKGTVAYAILREDNASGTYNQIALVPFGFAGIFVDTSARSAMGAYRYKIQVQDICSRNSGASPAHRTMHLQANVAAINEVSLTWNAYEGSAVGNYTILRSVGGGFNSIGTANANTFTFTDQMAPAGPKAYLIWLDSTILCDVGTGFNLSYSNVVTVGSGVRIQELRATNINIYPNPSTGQVRIQSERNMEQLIVRDMRGRLVLSTKPQTAVYDLNLTALEKGVYVVEVKADNGQLFKRLILQ